MDRAERTGRRWPTAEACCQDRGRPTFSNGILTAERHDHKMTTHLIFIRECILAIKQCLYLFFGLPLVLLIREWSTQKRVYFDYCCVGTRWPIIQLISNIK